MIHKNINYSLSQINIILKSLFLLGLGIMLGTNCNETARPNQNPQELAILTQLSEYDLFDTDENGKLIPKQFGTSYTLNTSLFSDYTHKDRVIFLPKDSQIQYESDKVFTMPIGTIISKTFSMPSDLTKPNEDLLKLETRLLIYQPKGWFAVSYTWNQEGTDAEIAYAGKNIPIQFKDTDGKKVNFTYSVPSRNQCTSCHQSYEGRSQSIVPIGPKAKHLNKEISMKDGIRKNQLSIWKEKGILAGLPMFAVPKLVDAFDNHHSVEDRARAYLDINCSHCHQGTGAAGMNSKLILNAEESNLSELGLCKTPGSAGKGGGGLRYDIVPGNADASILYYRMATQDSGAMMPQIGRALVHKEGLELIRNWINEMPAKECP